MASSGAANPLGRLWQFPFLVALGLFGYATYLFIDPKPGLTVRQRINLSEDLIKHDRPEAAIEELNNLLGTKLAIEDEVRIPPAAGRGGRCRPEAESHRDKVQLRADGRPDADRALAEGACAGGEAYRRLGQAYEYLGRPLEALENYRSTDVALSRPAIFRGSGR